MSFHTIDDRAFQPVGSAHQRIDHALAVHLASQPSDAFWLAVHRVGIPHGDRCIPPWLIGRRHTPTLLSSHQDGEGRPTLTVRFQNEIFRIGS